MRRWEPIGYEAGFSTRLHLDREPVKDGPCMVYEVAGEAWAYPAVYYEMAEPGTELVYLAPSMAIALSVLDPFQAVYVNDVLLGA